MLMVSYKDQLHKCQLPTNEQQTITVGPELGHTITFLETSTVLQVEWDGEKCTIQSQQLALHEHLSIDIDSYQMSFHLISLTSENVYDLSREYQITFGVDHYEDVSVHTTDADFIWMRKELTDLFQLEVYQGNVYHNFSLVKQNVTVKSGDQIFFDGILMIFDQDRLQVITSEERLSTTLIPLMEKESAYSNEYPDYHRSPRIIYREPVEKETIAKPPAPPSKPSEQLARTIVPPLVMIGALGIISIIQPRGIYILVMLSMTVVTIIFSVSSYIKNLKQYRIDSKERTKTYNEYLRRKMKEFYHISEEQRHALFYHYPDIEQIQKMAIHVDSRTFEKTMFHHDFLNYRVGMGEVESSFEIDFNEEEFSQEKDELIDEARDLYKQYQSIEHVPITTSLMKGPVGYIGQRQLVIDQLQLLILQTALFHSYYDLQFITIFPEEEKSQWEWMRWLPHATLQAMNVRGFVYHERSRDQVMHSLYQILKERQHSIDEQDNHQEKTYFSPHYVVLITDEQLILDHTIMEFFDEDPSDLGVSLIFVQEVMESLPEHVKTVIDIRDATNGNILLEEGDLVNRSFTLDHFPDGFNKEKISRALAPLNHLQTLKSSIPETVTFLEMYDAEKVEEFNLKQQWAINETYKSMAVPVGLRGKDDIVYLNLHEKAHGPHGLIAGTTGSGKSEIIQSYIISLAVNFHPYEVAFLLIDYKGGGMANLFQDLPHLLGTITNLDGAQSMRALASIKAELQKRQRLFGEYDVNHIHQYQKLYKLGKASEPMPHLFLISDEFAELKAEQPDFMKELVSTARIGRSLGIHLILATQKPSGVVDDQIWSNSKFKIALKVQDAGDSNEILKTPDAAEITLPGRAYLQVGNNEIYELFQSAWSGADYVPDQDDQAYIDTTIYAINELGQYDILTEDLSGLEHKEEVEKTATELEAVIEYIHNYVEEEQIQELPRPWLPPLKERIFIKDLYEVDYAKQWKEDKQPLQATVGLLDIPEMQAQEPLTLDITKDGHVAIFASPGFGKSTFLQSIAMDLARNHTPERLHIYLIDLGTNGLIPLRDLPHVADVMMVDEEIKLGKLFRRLANELKNRKQKLSEYGVATIDMYERASKKEVPHILLLIDTIDSVMEVDYREEFESMLSQIAREGAGVGIHLVATAGRQTAIRTPILANIKNQISLYLIDDIETRGIIGRTSLNIEEIPGRGLVKLEDPTSFQTALPVEGEDTLMIVENIQREAKEMAQAWTGDRPLPIPMVPEVLPFEDFVQRDQTKEMIQQGKIPFAVDFEDVEPMELSVQSDQNTLILGEMMDTIEQIYLTIVFSISMNEEIDVGLIDNTSGSFGMYRDRFNIFADESSSMDDFINQLQSLYEAREDAFKELQDDTEGRATISEFLQELRPMIVLMTDAVFVINTLSSTTQQTLANLIDIGNRMGIYFVIGSIQGAIDRLYDDVTTAIKKQKNGILIGRISDQNMLEVMNRPYREANLLPYEAYYIKHGHAEKIKIASPQ